MHKNFGMNDRINDMNIFNKYQSLTYANACQVKHQTIYSTVEMHQFLVSEEKQNARVLYVAFIAT